MNKHLSFRPVLTAFCAALLIGAGPSSPSLPLTVAFLNTGGGAGSFSTVRAFDNIVGADALQNELRTLRTTYGGHNVDRFVSAFDFIINDGWKRAGEADVKMPAASTQTGKDLLGAMIQAGTPPGGKFQIATMMDALLTSKVHAQVGADLAARDGSDAVANFERIGTQFFTDLAQSSP